jgi:hypothetical protein
MMRAGELELELARLPVIDVTVRRSFGAALVRFRATKAP